MATHRIDLLNASAIPFDGNCYFSPYVAINSGSTQNPLVLVMTQTTCYIQGCFRVPENYVGTPVLSIIWTSETAAGDVDFVFRHRTTDGSDSELLDISTSPSEISDSALNNTGPSAASEQMLDTISLTTTDLTAGSICYFEFERNSADTKADDITVWGLYFEFADA